MEKRFVTDKDGNTFLPITSASAVMDANNRPVSNVLNEKADKSDTYTKEEVNSLVTTPEVQYVTVEATSATTSATELLPESGSGGTIYRIGKWDGEAYNISCFSEYGWAQTMYVLLDVKEYGIDDEPTAGSQKLVKSGGVFDCVITNGSAFDISAHFASGSTLATYADLSAALTALNTLSASYKRGGMSIKYVQSSDNKYIQARCMAQNFSTDPNDWQGVDAEPIANSKNLVESGGVAEKIDGNYNVVSSINGNTESGSSQTKSIILLWRDENNSIADGSIIYVKCDLGTAQLQYWRLQYANYDASAGLGFSEKITVFNTWVPIVVKTDGGVDVNRLNFNVDREDITTNGTISLSYANSHTYSPVKRIEDLELQMDETNADIEKLNNAISNKQEKLVVGTNLDNDAINGSNNPITSGAVYPLKRTVLGETDYLAENITVATTSATQARSTLWDAGDTPLENGTKIYVKVDKTNNNEASYWRIQYVALDHSTSLGYSDYIDTFGEWVEVTISSTADVYRIQCNIKADYIKNTGQLTFSIATSYAPSINEQITPLVTSFNDSLKSGLRIERGLSLTGEYKMTDFKQFIGKNLRLAFCCDIDANFSSVELGTEGINQTDTVAYGKTNRIVVDATNLTIYRMKPNHADVVVTTYSHGLTIADALHITIEAGDNDNAKITLECNGVIYSVTLETTAEIHGWECCSYYYPYCEAVGCTVNNWVLSASCTDFNKKIWVIGDSYLRLLDTRWAYYLHEDGYDKNIMLVRHGGAKSRYEGIRVLDVLLNVAKPKYIVWCLGINDNPGDENTGWKGDVDGEPAEHWVLGRDKLLEVCQQHNIIPVFTTIPTVPYTNSEIKNEWIRNSGYQYIDIAKAVGANSSGVWRTGLRENELTTGNVGRHPSVLGAKCIYRQVLTDFPQIMQTT